jgi:hypothetical protein
MYWRMAAIGAPPQLTDTHAGEDAAQILQDGLSEYRASILGHKDPIHLHQEYTSQSII